MTLDPSQLPDDIAILKAMVIAGGREIAALKLTIAKMRRDKFGASSERGAKLLDQLELQLAELEEGVAQDVATVQIKAHARDSTGEQRLKPARRATASAFPARTRSALPSRPSRQAHRGAVALGTGAARSTHTPPDHHPLRSSPDAYTVATVMLGACVPHDRMQEPSLSHRRPRLGCLFGTFSPTSRRQIR